MRIIPVFLVIIMGFADHCLASVCGIDKTIAVKANVKIIRPLMGALGEEVKGIGNKFCLVYGKEGTALIDYKTLTSRSPSIAASYLISGLNMKAIEQIPGGNDHEELVCKALDGSMLTIQMNGGYITPGDMKNVCVFGDGSRIGISELRRSSINPKHLGLREAVRSKPLSVDLPYQLTTQPKPHTNVVNFYIVSNAVADFSWSGESAITPEQPFDYSGANYSPPAHTGYNGELTITVDAGRSKSSGPAIWWSQHAYVKGVSDSFTASSPADLNFAFTGIMTIKGTQYPIVIGQGSSIKGNNWWVSGSSSVWEWVPSLSGSQYGNQSLPSDAAIITPDKMWAIVANTAKDFMIYYLK